MRERGDIHLLTHSLTHSYTDREPSTIHMLKVTEPTGLRCVFSPG
jgi:hypothetical protein